MHSLFGSLGLPSSQGNENVLPIRWLSLAATHILGGGNTTGPRMVTYLPNNMITFPQQINNGDLNSQQGVSPEGASTPPSNSVPESSASTSTSSPGTNNNPSTPPVPPNLHFVFQQAFPGMPIVIQMSVGTTGIPGATPSTIPTGGDGGQQQFEALLSALFARAMEGSTPVDKGTAKSTLSNLPKYVLVQGGDTTLGNVKISIRELKRNLNALNIDHSKCIEKAELVKLLEDNTTIHPMECSSTCGHDYTCTICADEMQPGELVTKLPCGHWYHYGHGMATSSTAETSQANQDDYCPGIMKWLQEHNTCPNCKSELPKELDAVTQQQNQQIVVRVPTPPPSDAADCSSGDCSSDDLPPAMKRSRSE